MTLFPAGSVVGGTGGGSTPRSSPSTAPAPLPSSVISGGPTQPGCMVPSIVVSAGTVGSAEVTPIVAGPPTPMLKPIVFGAVALAANVSASRRVQTLG